jgi:hypothetical protein
MDGRLQFRLDKTPRHAHTPTRTHMANHAMNPASVQIACWRAAVRPYAFAYFFYFTNFTNEGVGAVA